MPNRAAPLSWTPEPSPARAELVEAALALADRDGLEAVSIRRVAAEAGQRPMSLYTHVASKDDLVALMFDSISAELLVPEPLPTDGRELLRLIARRSLDTYLAHPWMLHAFSRRPAAGPNQLRRAEQSARAVEALGIRPEQAWTALGIVHEWTMGHALHVVTLREDRGLADHLREVDPERFPRTAGALSSGSAPASADRFEEALESILDGIEQRFGR